MFVTQHAHSVLEITPCGSVVQFWALIFISTATLLAFLLFFVVFFSPLFPSLLEFELSSLPTNFFSLSVLIDSIALKFILTVLLISTRVSFYSHGYIDDENNSTRFMLLVTLFVIRILILIVGGRVPLLFLGWDGLGLSSYFLIVHYQTIKPSGRGLTTVIRNRIGDIFIILRGIIIISEISSWFFYNSSLSFTYLFLLSTALLLGAITKRAMFPYCTWLPEAIAAPTPVSSLVHSSTLVTAGVYLILRARVWFHPFLLILLAGIRSFTLLLSRGSALFCLDFKKVIALSTLSQLSFMFVTLAIGLPAIAFFHLITHALFKSSLFIAAGSYIHLTSANQDIRLNSILNAPFSSTILISIPIFALSGLPFLAGYFSKERILINRLSFSLTTFFRATIILGAFLTLLYRFRILYRLIFLNLPLALPKETLIIDTRKLLLLCLSVVGGWLYINNFQYPYSHSIGTSILVLSIIIIRFSIWLRKSLIFNPYLALSWNQFNYLSQTTKALSPSIQISTASFFGKLWERGWQESIGPKFISQGLSWALASLYNISYIQFNSLLIFLLRLFFIPLFIL